MEVFHVVKYIFFATIIVYYFTYTLRFARELYQNNLFAGKRLLVHSILIWIIPFLWITILQSLAKPIPGSHLRRAGSMGSGFDGGMGDDGIDSNDGFDSGGDGGGGDGGD